MGGGGMERTAKIACPTNSTSAIGLGANSVKAVELSKMVGCRIISTPMLMFLAVLIGFSGNAAASSKIGQQSSAQQLIEAVQGGASVFRAAPGGAAVHIQSGMVCVPGTD